MFDHFDLVDLRLFVNIAEMNSLTRGAERSHLSLPAASTRIKNLEDSLGTKLLYRASHGVTLTPPGQALLHHALQMQRQMEHLCSDMQEYAQGVKGHIRVFANTTAITEFLPSVLSRFLTTHRNVNVDLRERLSPSIVRAVSDGTADIGIVAGTVAVADLEVFPFRVDRFVLVVAPGHPLAALDRIAFADVLDHDFIGLERTSALQRFLSEKADRIGRRIKLRVQLRSFDAICRLVSCNVGIGVVPETTAERSASAMALHRIALTDDWALRELRIVVRRAADLPLYARDLVQYLAGAGSGA